MCNFSREDATTEETKIGTFMMREEKIAFASGDSGAVWDKTVSFTNRYYGKTYFNGTHFKAPASGYYTFTFSGSSYCKDTYLSVKSNGQEVHKFRSINYKNYHRSFTQVFTLDLKKGHVFNLYIGCVCRNVYSCLEYSRFLSGHLVHQYP